MVILEPSPPRFALAANPIARRFLVFHADDLGLTFGFNEGTRQAHLHGLVTSTCLQSVGYAYDHAVREVLPECPSLGVGIHLNLVECRPMLRPELVPDLVDAGGSFRGYRPLLAATWNRRIRGQIRDECRAQIERPLADGVALDHVNSHRHAHMLPGMFDVVCELAVEYGIGFVRLTHERFHRPRPLRSGGYLWRDGNLAKQVLMNMLALRNRPRLQARGLRSNTGFVGLSYTGFGDEHAVQNALAAHANEPLVELLLHTCLPHDQRDAEIPSPSIRAYCNAPHRQAESQVATSHAIREAIARMGFELTNYRTLSAISDQPDQLAQEPARTSSHPERSEGSPPLHASGRSVWRR